MDDRSTVKPILDVIEYFKESDVELKYFYSIIDKFCAKWFKHPVVASKFDSVDLALIHELLGEYIRFEVNSKKMALWLFSINRVCYNYNSDLSAKEKEIELLKDDIGDFFDTSLISPIIDTIIHLEDEHLKAGSKDKGENDSIGNLLQWIDVYTTYVYPSLENKTDFNDRALFKAMIFLLSEFLQQKTNNMRFAYLILTVMEACKQYSLTNKFDSEFINKYDKTGMTVFAGQDESLVQELLKKLSKETVRQKSMPIFSKETIADDFLKTSFDKLIEDMNREPSEAVTEFNNYLFSVSSKFLTLDIGKQFLFLQVLYRYKSDARELLSKEVHDNLKKSIDMLGIQTKLWLKKELEQLEKRKELYGEYVIQKIVKDSTTSRENSARLFIILYLTKKFNLI